MPTPVATTGLKPLLNETGKIYLSVDGKGTDQSTGLISVQKRLGATVRKAYLIGDGTSNSSYGTQVTVEGALRQWDRIETTNTNNGFTFYSYLSDVTELVRNRIDSAPAGEVSVRVDESSQASSYEGLALAVLFDDPKQPTKDSVILYFGGLRPAGGLTTINFGSPAKRSAGLSATLGLGIGYSYNGGNSAQQVSNVSVNGQLLTSTAGNFDDGSSTNGRLFTVGGFKDSKSNPNPTSSDPTLDDELYDVLPFIKDGDTEITIETNNPSDDDHIFFSHLTLSGIEATVEAAVVDLSVTPSSVTEGDGQGITYSFFREGDVSTPLTVRFTVGGKATIGSDYTASGAKSFTATEGSVEFAAGASSATIRLKAHQDSLQEGSEDIQLTLLSDPNYVIGTSVAVVSAINDTVITPTVPVSPVVPVPAPLPTPVIPAAPLDPFLSFTPLQLPSSPTNPQMAKYYDYVDRYPLSLKTAFIADYKSGKSASQALWGQQHWLASGSKQGRVLEVVAGSEDLNDYAAYVENYGTTLLDIYRNSASSNPNSPDYRSLFSWGKDHYNTVGKKAGRQIDGGADWGAIVMQNFDLYTRWQDARIVDPSISAFGFGYRNQNVVKNTLGVKIGRDTSDRMSGVYVYSMGGNDVISGTTNDDILSGGFGDDLVIGGSGGSDTAFGGPGQDVFRIARGGTLNIRDFRRGADFIQLGNGLSESEVTLVFDGLNKSTVFKVGSETIATVYGTNPNDFSFAAESDGITNTFI